MIADLALSLLVVVAALACFAGAAACSEGAERVERASVGVPLFFGLFLFAGLGAVLAFIGVVAVIGNCVNLAARLIG